MRRLFQNAQAAWPIWSIPIWRRTWAMGDEMSVIAQAAPDISMVSCLIGWSGRWTMLMSDTICLPMREHSGCIIAEVVFWKKDMWMPTSPSRTPSSLHGLTAWFVVHLSPWSHSSQSVTRSWCIWWACLDVQGDWLHFSGAGFLAPSAQRWAACRIWSVIRNPRCCCSYCVSGPGCSWTLGEFTPKGNGCLRSCNGFHFKAVTPSICPTGWSQLATQL